MSFCGYALEPCHTPQTLLSWNYNLVMIGNGSTLDERKHNILFIMVFQTIRKELDPFHLCSLFLSPKWIEQSEERILRSAFISRCCGVADVLKKGCWCQATTCSCGNLQKRDGLGLKYETWLNFGCFFLVSILWLLPSIHRPCHEQVALTQRILSRLLRLLACGAVALGACLAVLEETATTTNWPWTWSNC